MSGFPDIKHHKSLAVAVTAKIIEYKDIMNCDRVEGIRLSQILSLVLLSHVRLGMLIHMAETVSSSLKWKTREMPTADLMRWAGCQCADGTQEIISHHLHCGHSIKRMTNYFFSQKSRMM